MMEIPLFFVGMSEDKAGSIYPVSLLSAVIIWLLSGKKDWWLKKYKTKMKARGLCVEKTNFAT